MMTAAQTSIPPLNPTIRFTARPFALPALLIATALVIAIGLPWLIHLEPNAIDLRARLQEPILFGGSWSHPLGTDQLGRDIGIRMLAGAKISLLVAIAATLLAGLIGSTIGLTGGYLGGVPDRVALWLGDLQLAIPFVIIAIGVSAVLTPSVLNVILILGTTGWATYARVARLSVIPLRNAPFVDAARVNGVSQPRIVTRHLLPVVLPPLIAIASQQAGAMILYEAALSFLGLGVPGGTITWGRMIADARDASSTAWWATVMPGLAIVFIVLGFNALGSYSLDRMGGSTGGSRS
jgi:peptide/nickel transport system permease protein